MFANFNYDKFPLVYVIFSESLASEEEFDNFLKEWLVLYHNQNNFMYIFDTRMMKIISPIYSLKMAFFIKKLRKQPIHYLEKSLILVNDNRIKKLLDMVFTLQSPVAPVYLWMTERIDKDEIYNMCENCSVDNILEDMIYIKPNSSLIPFL
tara:strand:+ start:48 stop:500 length:453 start_codon:yes stop_codon:yes gene_type:complete